MKTLAIDTSLSNGSVAAVDGGRIAVRLLSPAGEHARLLAAAIDSAGAVVDVLAPIIDELRVCLHGCGVGDIGGMRDVTLIPLDPPRLENPHGRDARTS